jgi:hypothetical protein
LKLLEIVKGIIIILFLILVLGKYFNWFENYQLTDTITLFDTRHWLVILYVLIRVWEYVNRKKIKKNG